MSTQSKTSQPSEVPTKSTPPEVASTSTNQTTWSSTRHTETFTWMYPQQAERRAQSSHPGRGCWLILWPVAHVLFNSKGVERTNYEGLHDYQYHVEVYLRYMIHTIYIYTYMYSNRNMGRKICGCFCKMAVILVGAYNKSPM